MTEVIPAIIPEIIKQTPAVNYHLWVPCNMRCGFCFAPFEDVKADLPKGHLEKDASIAVIKELAGAGFAKINFAGGEPTLCPWLPELIAAARATGMITAIVTNGSKITPKWLDMVSDNLNWVTLSIDTIDPEKLKQSGRATSYGPISETEYLQIAAMVRQYGIRLKVNTVVTQLNWQEDFTEFIIRINPERWKLLQVLPVAGQNDRHIAQFAIEPDQFDAYVARNRQAEASGITVVPESNEMMTGSYLMVDPAGRFFDNTKGEHGYSDPILDVGIAEALKQVTVLPGRFRERGGVYDW